MYQESKRTCTAIVLLIKPLFSDVPVAVAVVVFLNSLLSQDPSQYRSVHSYGTRNWTGKQNCLKLNIN